MAFKSAAYAVVARVFELLDENGFIRIQFAKFIETIVSIAGTYYGFVYNDTDMSVLKRASLGFKASPGASGAGEIVGIVESQSDTHGRLHVHKSGVSLYGQDTAAPVNYAGINVSEIAGGQVYVDAINGNFLLDTDTIDVGVAATRVDVNGSDMWGGSYDSMAIPTGATALAAPPARTTIAGPLVIAAVPYPRLIHYNLNMLATLAGGGIAYADYYIVSTASGGFRARRPVTPTNMSTGLDVVRLLPANTADSITVEILPNVAGATITVSGGADLNGLRVISWRAGL